jgi:membrane protein YdbS with pleckstrin-like domain
MSSDRILGFRRPSAVVQGYLTDGESVLFEEAPLVLAWWLNRGTEYAIAVVLLGMIGIARTSAVTGVGLLMLGGLAVWLGAQFMQYEFTRYVLTDYRALRVSGVLRRDYEWMSWSKVSDVSVHRSLLDRLMGTAHVHIQSANEQSEFKAISDVPFPNDFADLILRLVQRSYDPITGVEAYQRERRPRPWRT